MKQAIFLLISAISLTASGQFTVKQPRELQHVYMFATDNPDSVGHLEWAFHDSIIYKECFLDHDDKHMLWQKKIKTEKPFVFLDSAGIVVYMYQTDEDVMAILYSDEKEDLITLCIGWPLRESLDIYSVVHFW